MTSTQKKKIKQKQSEDYLRIQDLFYLSIIKWRWFVFSLFMALSLAGLYLLTTPSIYMRSASILIKEDSKGQSLSSDVASLFANFGLSQSNANVNNELLAIQSPAVILETVKRLHLEVNYEVKGFFHNETLYDSDLPIRVTFLDLKDEESAELKVRLMADGKVELSNFQNDGDIANDILYSQLRDTVATPLGRIVIEPTPHYLAQIESEINVFRSNLYDATDACKSNLMVSISEEKSTVINLSYKDLSIRRAEDVLNTLIAAYKESWMEDKNQITISTSMFINERLEIIERELRDVDQDISSYKSQNLLPDIEVASGMYMNQSRETNNLLLQLNTQLSMSRYIRNYLTSITKKGQLLPANSGIENSGIEKLIGEYNTFQLQYNNLVGNSSEQNPLAVDLEQSLNTMRKAIISSVDNQVLTLTTQIANLQKDEKQTTAQIAANPNQAKYLLSVGRQQKIKEALYLFLLQKREENELSKAFTAYNTRIISSPTGSLRPTTPVTKNVLLVAIALGLLIPILIIFIRENMNTSVRGRKDLEDISLPFVGEIPLISNQKQKKNLFSKQSQARSIVVKEGIRDIPNEAFRVLRTNLEFMIGNDRKSNVIMLTSFNPGSGKTFITMNLAVSLAVKGKKVLVIDGDLRLATLSSYVESPKMGLSNYLGKQIDQLDDIIISDEKYETLNIIPVGTIPPNPTELLFEERLEHLIEEVRDRYDFVFIDCPPIEIVADTSIIDKLVDRTIFIVRAGLLERSLLVELEQLYQEQKFKNMSLILNGTTGTGRRYEYRYHYGYGRGYDYYSDNNQHKSTTKWTSAD